MRVLRLPAQGIFNGGNGSADLVNRIGCLFPDFQPAWDADGHGLIGWIVLPGKALVVTGASATLAAMPSTRRIPGRHLVVGIILLLLAFATLLGFLFFQMIAVEVMPG